ncbi:hypothetical protein LEMLEM_LOCUS20548 [Lemmus lemmus]
MKLLPFLCKVPQELHQPGFPATPPISLPCFQLSRQIPSRLGIFP